MCTKMGIMERLLILEINSVTIVLFWNLLGTGRLSSLITVVVIQSGVKKTVHILELARIQKKTGTTAHVMLLWGGSVRNWLSTELYVYMLLKGIVPVPSHQEYLLKRFIWNVQSTWNQLCHGYRHCLYLCRFKWKKSCTVTPEVEVESHCNFKK